MPLRVRLLPFVLLAVLVFQACTLLDPEAPGALVPPTAEEDAALPHLRVTVAGSKRTLHLQTFGDPAHPPLFVLPGGPGVDFRPLLPLSALSDRYFVVMWDARGAGLSERVPAAELTLDSFNDEIDAVREALALGRSITLVGHSFGALFALRYAATHPDRVDQLVLIEPGPISPRAQRHYRGGAMSFADGQDFFWTNELLTSSDHAAADYKAVALLPLASKGFYCPGSAPDTYPMWRFGALHHHVVAFADRRVGDAFVWTVGFERFAPRVQLIAGSCGDAGADFQRAYNLPSLSNARLDVVEGAGHMTLFSDYAAQTLAALKTYLNAYRP